MHRNASLVAQNRKNILEKSFYSTIFPIHHEGSLKGSYGRKVKRKKHNAKKQHENLAPDNEKQILFANQMFKTPKVSRKCDNQSKITRKSNSKYHIYDLQKNNCLFAYLCNDTNRSNKNVRRKKRVRWKTSKKPFLCCRHFFQNINEKSPLRQKHTTNSNRFNKHTKSIINNSDSIDTKLRKNISKNAQENNISQNKFLCIDQQVSITPSRLPTSVENLIDAIATTKQFLNIKFTSSTNNINHKNCNCCDETNLQFNKTTSNNRFNIITKALPFVITISKKCSTYGAFIVKSILFGIIFIAWIPCIFVILTFWTLTYPLRPHFILTDNLPDTQQFCMAPCNSWKTCMSNMFNYVTVILHKAFHLGKYMISPLHNQNYDKGPLHRQDRHKSHEQKHPNPTRKYTLCYAKNRGWTIKPIPQQLVGKRTCVDQTQRNLCRQDSREKYKQLSKNAISEKNTCYNECHCLHDTNKVTPHMPMDMTEKIQLSPRNENHSKYPQAQYPNLTTGSQQLPLKSLNKGSEYLQRTHHNRLQSYHDSFKPHSYLNQQMTNNSIPLQNTHKYIHQHTLKDCRPIQNDIQKLDHLPSVDVRTMKSRPLESEKCRHHKTIFNSSRMGRPLLPSTIPLSCNCIKSPRRYQASEVCKRHTCNLVQARDKCTTKIISIFKSSLTKNLDPRLCSYVKPYLNSRKNKKYFKIKQKIRCFCKRSCRKLNAIVTDADAQIWSGDIQCNTIYDVISKKGPYFWFFRSCPPMYTCFHKLYKFSQIVCFIMLYLISLCVWCPIVCCICICYEAICQCAKY